MRRPLASRYLKYLGTMHGLKRASVGFKPSCLPVCDLPATMQFVQATRVAQPPASSQPGARARSPQVRFPQAPQSWWQEDERLQKPKEAGRLHVLTAAVEEPIIGTESFPRPTHRGRRLLSSHVLLIFMKPSWLEAAIGFSQ